MKKTGLLFCLLLVNFISIAQETEITLLSNNPSSIVLHYNFGKYTLNTQLINGEVTVYPEMINATPLLDAKAPDLSKISESITIPKGATVSYEIINELYVDIENTTVRPSKGNLYRNVDPTKIPYEFGAVYSKDNWYPKSLVTVNKEYQLKDLAGRAVWVYPFRVHPTKNILRVYQELTIKINIISEESVSLPAVNPIFNAVYKNQFSNYESSLYESISEQGNMLIISHADYIEEMIPFRNWKTQIGIENEIVDVATIGDAAAIKAYVQEYYDTNSLTYLLLVGDNGQVPADQLSAGYSDNSYAYVAGEDHYPDLFVGRFSVESIQDVQTMVNRTINYELNPSLDNSYKNAACIGSEDGTESTDPNSETTGMGDNGEADWHHQMKIKADLQAYNYSLINEFYEGGPYNGSIDAAGNPPSSLLFDAVNNGLGLINYTGHGSAAEFVTTGFNNSDVNNLTNSESFPFIFSVACVNGEFMNSTCFAEHWLRATNSDGEPTGAISAIMSTINQSWNPPMLAQDEMNDLLTEQYEDNICRSFGAITMQGCMKMNDDYGSAGDEMTDTWMIFGDPSVVLRTDKAVNATAVHEEIMPIGSTSFSVSSSNEGAIVALTYNNEIIAEGVIVEGLVVLNFDPLIEIGAYTLTVTAYNMVPSISTIQSIVLDGAYIIHEGLELTSSLDGSDGQADYGDVLVYNLGLENVGIDSTQTLTVTATSESTFISIISEPFTISTIGSNEVYWMLDAVELQVNANISDQSTAVLDFEITSSDGLTWFTSSTITLSAPVLSADTYIVNDSLENGNALMELGESFVLGFPISNSGFSSSASIIATLETDSPYLIIETLSDSINSLNSNGSNMVYFTCSLPDDLPVSTDINFTLNLNSDPFNFETPFTFTSSSCGVGFLDIQFVFSTDEYVDEETSLSLLDVDGVVYQEFILGSLTNEFEYDLSYCAAPNTIMQLVITDNYGDGITNGFYSITVCDQNLVESSEGGFSEITEYFLVSCDQGLVVFGCMDDQAFNYDSQATYSDNSCMEVIEGCTDATAFNYGSTANTNDGSCIYSLSCEDGFNEVVVTINSDNYGGEISWSLQDDNDLVIAAIEPDVLESNTTYNSAYCLSDTNPITFTITDSYGDGLTDGDGSFTLTLCGDVILSGANYGTSDEISFLGCSVYNVGINEIKDSNWSLFPNPISGSSLWINSESILDLTITDLLGHKLLSVTIEEGRSLVQLPKLSTGVYLVSTSTGKVKRLIVY